MTEVLHQAVSTGATRVVANKAFEAALGKLNPAQREAVELVEGPVMVVAGPGTGKTQVIALRVASILNKTHARPSNILCLTFSKSGATAMRERLRTFLGADAYRVTVDTIHGFCNDVIIQHPSVFENWSMQHQISDVERYRELNKIIDQLSPHSVLVNPKSPYSKTSDILSRISQIKREGVTKKDHLFTIADAYDVEMAEKSREGTKAHEQNILRAQKFREFLEVFFCYQEMLCRTHRYDYEDMILTVLDAFNSEDWMLAGLQERCQYILVDEFQDTNGAQYQVIEALTKDISGDDNPNLCVVGDDDQAIYRFQGANIGNMLAFRERFPTAPIIALTQSYRCTQPILDAAAQLISANTERLVGQIEELTKDLTSQKEAQGDAPKLLLAPSDMAEPWIVANLVQERIEQGIPAEEIAVLVQTNAELLPFYEVFQSQDIPVQMIGKLDLLSNPLVQQVIAILRAIESPQQSACLAEAFSCPCFSVHPADLGRLFILQRGEDASLYQFLLGLESHPSYDQFLDVDHLIGVRDVLLSLHFWSKHRTAIATLEAVYRECNLLQSARNQSIDIIDFAALQEFFDRIRKRAAEDSHFTFEVLLSDLQYYANPEYRDVRLSYDLPHVVQGGVQLMTAHKSKGLEFSTVILANFREGHWDKRRPPSSISIPEDLLFGWQKTQKQFERQQDERRVAYVAMTRAKRELIFTCPRALSSGDSMKAVSPSGFFAEAGNLPEENTELDGSLAHSTLLAPTIRNLDEEEQAFLTDRLGSFVLSPTALSDFLEDPQRFKEIHLLNRPRAKEPYFAYGNAVHHALAHWAQKLKEGTKISAGQLIEQFSWHLCAKEILTDTERKRLDHLGKGTLERYYEMQLASSQPCIEKIEYALTCRLKEEKSPTDIGVPLKGKIDRIDLVRPDSGRAIIHDYKTGKPKSENACRDAGYVRQLTFYALLLEHSMPFLTAEQFILNFVGEGVEHPRAHSFTISEDEKRELREVIRAVWAKITALDFTEV